ncbi:methionine--tRNA ligase subunit beta [Candidatus Daviesbacteria bacterium]|nr:methionine--tRNA ligase subunit beta [Candidatus Daviesbacteria bacterium]
MISFEDFAKLELKVGTVLEAEEVEGSEKLIKLIVDLGEDNSRQVLAGVKQWYKPKDFVGKQVVLVANLEPKMMMGLESQGMMLAADTADGPVFLTVPKKSLPAGRQVPAGTKVR